MTDNRATGMPPEWALEPLAAWIYLALVIALAFTPLFALNLVFAIIAAVFTHQDRKAHGLPTFGWTAGVVVFGPLAYIFYVYKRPRAPVVFTPQAAVSQRGRPIEGRQPLPSGSTPPSATPIPDWYPDPTGEARLRYWDGSKWTTHITQ